MPAALSCKSASALDSLPRSTNAKRSGTALHRLQQQQQQQQQPASTSPRTDLRSSKCQHHAAPTTASTFCDAVDGLNSVHADDGAVSVEQRPLSPVRNRRRLSANLASPRRQRSQKSGKGVASNDLPLASSDLGSMPHTASELSRSVSESRHDHRERGGEMENVSILSGNAGRPTRAKSLSSQSPLPLQEAAGGFSNAISARNSRATSPASQGKPASMPDRKRVITKAMIGNPTSFRHTGHIGTGAYGTMLDSCGVAEADGVLEQQLSEVAAALQLREGGQMWSSSAGDMESKQKTAISETRPLAEGDKRFHRHALQMSEIAEDIPVEENLKQSTHHCHQGTGSQTLLEGDDQPNSTIENISDAASLAQHAASPSQLPTAESDPPLKRQASKRKPLPVPRNLADLCAEMSPSPVKEQCTVETSSKLEKGQVDAPPARDGQFERAIISGCEGESKTVALATSETESAPDLPCDKMSPSPAAKQLPTLRANGKRFVQGPAGEYITDTANGRWNHALTEIAAALKADDDPEFDGNDTDVLHRTDHILQRFKIP